MNARTQGSTRAIANVYYNLNAGDPTKLDCTRTASTAVRATAYSDRTSNNGSVRVTWQVTPRNKISGFWDEQANCREVHGPDHRHHRSGARLARSPGNGADEPAARAAGDLGIARHQQAAARCRLRRHVLRMGQLRTQPEPDARSDQHGRAVRAELRRTTATRRRAWSTGRRTGAPTLPRRGTGRRRWRMSPARTA